LFSENFTFWICLIFVGNPSIMNAQAHTLMTMPQKVLTSNLNALHNYLIVQTK